MQIYNLKHVYYVNIQLVMSWPSSKAPSRAKPGLESRAQAKPTGWLAGPHSSASMF
jgi:hypothetical protein